MKICPFCSIPQHRILGERGPCLSFSDLFPVSPGHLLIIPRRHVASFREMTEEEWAAVLWLAKDQAARLMEEDGSIEGYNLGINDGASAGQTVFHAHIHLIPRRRGDAANPRGGVRGVIPGKAAYPFE